MTISTADGITLPVGEPPDVPPGGTPGYNPNALLDGGQVIWISGYDFVVQAATYQILGENYASPQTSVTLDTADPTFDRFDVFAVDINGDVVVIEGTPAADPVKPVVDPATQLELTFVRVQAATGPINLSSLAIYNENVEWTSSESGTSINLASTNNPYSGTVDVEATAMPAGDWFQFVGPGPGVITSRDNLTFFIRSKAQWPNPKGLVMQWSNGTTPVGVPVTLSNGQFNFNSAITANYQAIVVPLYLFGITGLEIDRIRFTCAGGGGGIGFYFDLCSVQGGIAPSTNPTGYMRWRGVHSTLSSYAINDVVSYGGWNYLCLVAHQNVLPTSADTVWYPIPKPAVLTLTDAATVNWNVAEGNVAELTLGGNRTMAAPTNLRAGMTGALKIIQGVGSNTLTWNAVYKFPGGTDPTLSTTLGDYDVVTWICFDGTNLDCVWQGDFA